MTQVDGSGTGETGVGVSVPVPGLPAPGVPEPGDPPPGVEAVKPGAPAVGWEMVGANG